MKPIYVLRVRPHIGCGVGRWIYDVRDAKTGELVRSQISPPSEQDCIDAVMTARNTPRTASTHATPVGGVQGGRRSKRQSRVDLYNL